MIVIRARGATQVKALEKLVEEMSAEEVQIAPKRRDVPTVSTLPGATIAPATQAAIMQMNQTIEGLGGGYESV